MVWIAAFFLKVRKAETASTVFHNQLFLASKNSRPESQKNRLVWFSFSMQVFDPPRAATVKHLVCRHPFSLLHASLPCPPRCAWVNALGVCSSITRESRGPCLKPVETGEKPPGNWVVKPRFSTENLPKWSRNGLQKRQTYVNEWREDQWTGNR